MEGNNINIFIRNIFKNNFWNNNADNEYDVV